MTVHTWSPVILEESLCSCWVLKSSVICPVAHTMWILGLHKQQSLNYCTTGSAPYPYHIKWTMRKLRYQLKVSKLSLISGLIRLNDVKHIQQLAWGMFCVAILYILSTCTWFCELVNGILECTVGMPSVPPWKDSSSSFWFDWLPKAFKLFHTHQAGFRVTCGIGGCQKSFWHFRVMCQLCIGTSKT